MLRKEDVRSTAAFLLTHLQEIDDQFHKPAQAVVEETKPVVAESFSQRMLAIVSKAIFDYKVAEQKGTDAESVTTFLRSKKKDPLRFDPTKTALLMQPKRLTEFMKHLVYAADDKVQPANPKVFLLSFLAYVYDLSKAIKGRETRQQFVIAAAIIFYRFAGPLLDFYGSWADAFSTLATSTASMDHAIQVAKLGSFLEKLLTQKVLLPQECLLVSKVENVVETRDKSQDQQIFDALNDVRSVNLAIERRIKAAPNPYQALISVLIFLAVAQENLASRLLTRKRLIEAAATTLHRLMDGQVERYGAWEGLLVCDMAKTDRQYYLEKLAFFAVYAGLFAKLKQVHDHPEGQSLAVVAICLFLAGKMTWEMVDPLAKNKTKPVINSQFKNVGLFAVGELKEEKGSSVLARARVGLR